MKNRFKLLLVFLILLAELAHARQTKVYPIKHLQKDFQQLTELIKIHPQLHTYTPKDSLDRLIQQQYEAVNRAMTVAEFYTICAPIVAAIRCGHSYVDMPKKVWTNHRTPYFPLQVRLHNDSLFLMEALNDIPAGSLIRTINQKSVEEIIQILKNNTSIDGYNPYGKEAKFNANFIKQLSTILHFPDEYQFRIQLLETKQFATASLNAKTLPNLTVPSRNPMSTCSKNLCFQPMEKNNAALLTIKSFSYYREEDFAHFKSSIDSSFQKINQQGLEQLIIDVRGNIGGNPYCGQYLLAYLIDKPFIYFKQNHESYGSLSESYPPKKQSTNVQPCILIDGAGFSTTGHFLALVKANELATLVGEELGSSFSCNDNGTWVTLSKTKLRVRMARETVQVAVDGAAKKGRGILPHYEVRPTVDDWLQKKDVVLEKALEVLE
ncbi:MAG: S41 family peptidase [Flammeovirgaceae bacterium]